jgi:hypothetical protein
MNEEAIKDSYNVFVSQGYTKSIDEYKKLIATNPDALNDSYNAFKAQGYNKSINEYKTLMGIGSQSVTPVQKKKFALDSSSEDGSLVSQKSPKPNMPVLTQEGFEQAMSKKKAVPTDMSGKALMKPASEIKKIKEKAAVLKGANKKSLETESSLEGAYPQAPLSEPIATLVTGVPGVPKIPTLTETIGVPTKKIIEQEYKDLDLDNPAPYLSASTYNRQPVNGIAINKDNFIEEVFTDEKLINLGIDPADFDGYLNLSGYKEDYNKRKDRGDFEVGSVENPKLNEELYKSKLLSNYVRTKNDREVLKSKLQSVKASYEGKKIPVNKNAKALDNNLIAKYTEENLPVLYKKLKEKDQLNKEKYKELTQDNTGLNSFAIGAKNTLRSALNGFVDSVNKASATVYDALGADDLAEDLRYLNEERQLERPSERQVSFASGKVVDLAGKKYLVDEKGTVYDKDNEIVVNDLIEEGSLNKILEEAKKSKEEDWFFSPQGTAVQTGSVLGDMVWQVAYQASIGRVTKGLGKLSIPKSTADAIIAQSSLGYAQAYQTTLKEARDAGLTDKEAEQIAGDAAQRTAIWYGMTAPISPQTKAVESLFGSAEKELIKKAVGAYKTQGKQSFISTLNNGLKQISKKTVGIVEEGGKEVVQENIQQAGESLWINAQKNIEAGREISDETMSFDDFVNTSILSFASGGLVSNLSMPSLPRNKKTQVRDLYQLSQNIDVLDTNLNEMVNNNIISKEDAENVKKDAIAVSRNITRIPKDTNPEVQLDVMRKLSEIEDLENSKNTLDKSFHSQIDEKIQEKRNEVKEIYDISLTTTTETDAVQEQSTTEVPVQSEAITSETLETGVSQPGPEVVTKQVAKEEVDNTASVEELYSNILNEYEQEVEKIINKDDSYGYTEDDRVKVNAISKQRDEKIQKLEDEYGKEFIQNRIRLDNANYNIRSLEESIKEDEKSIKGIDGLFISKKTKEKIKERLEKDREILKEELKIKEELEQNSGLNYGNFKNINIYRSPDGNFRILGEVNGRLKMYEPDSVSYKTEAEAKNKLSQYAKEAVIFNAQGKTDVNTKAEVPIVTEQVTQEEVTPSETITTEQEENKIESVRSNFENGNLQNIEINPTRQGFEGDFLNDYDFLAEGSEHTVYRSKDGKTVIKIGEPYGSNEGFMPRVEDALTISNLIGDGSLEVIGYYESNGVKNPIYQQNYIDGKTMTQEEVASHLESKGFVNLGNNKFAITVDGKTYEISDTSDNFIIDNQGNVSAIDAGIMELDVNKLTEEQKSKLKETTEQVVEPQAVSEQVETAPVVEEVNEFLNIDTKDKAGLKKVLDYLDSLDSSLDLDPNELNDVTRVMAIGTAKAVIKTLKALVKAGITLQEAINTAAEIHSVDTKDVLKAFDVIKQGGKQKSAPSPVKSDIYIGEGRLISIAKDIKKITMTEKALLVKQIRDKIKGAKDVIKATKEVSQQLITEIKELESTGKITPTQALNMISKFNKVNMLNDVSVANFIDYMSKVFADADYDNKINVAKSKLKAAKKNINTKIGIADGLVGPLQKLFSINPQLIPQAYLERYLELVDMFGARQAVLNLEEKSKVTKDVIEILDEINNEQSAVEELSERFNYSENQVIEDGKINYAATVKNMLKEGEITEEEAALMTKYKSEITPKVKREERTEEEIQEEKDELLAEVKKSTINSDDLPTRTERDAAKKLATLIKSPGVKELSNAQLKNLLKVIDNINNGYFAHSAHLITEEINSINNSKVLESSVNKAKLLPLSKLYSQAKSILTRKDAVLEMIRRNPLFNIDQVLGDFKTKDVFNSLLEKAAEGEAKFTAELKAIQLKLANAEEKIAKSFKLDANKTLMSKFKIMTYMVQLEYESNPDSKQVNPASKFIEATINHINEGKSQFGEKDAEMLQDILDNYTDADGNIDVKKLYNSFNSAEKSGIKTIQEVNQSLKEKAEYTASVIRGQRINPLSNYIHLNVLSDTKPNDLASGESFADQYNNSLKPSTKAKSLIERTGKVSPLNFDVFASAQKGAKSVLMDYHLTEPIRTGRKTINKTIASLGKIDKEKRRIINAIKKSFEEAVENLVNNSYMETSVGDDVADYIKKQGYRSVLAGTGRFAAEFLSNVGFVIISDPITFAEGLKYTPILMSPDAPSIMHNVNSKEINRIFPSDTLSGRLIDTNILSEANGIKGGKAKNRVINKAQQIWNLTGKKYKNAVELTADVLITTPDKAIMRPIWFGSFATNFKKETGKDVDFEKIAANDEAYISENKEAIDKAKDAADERSVITGASNNAFTGILKGTSKPNQSNFIKAFNNFNNFMSRFLIYEYTSARTGIYAAMGNGSLSRKQGIALLGAVTTRMTVYSLLAKALGGGLIGLLFGDDDDEDEKSLDKSIGQALTSTFTSLLFNRDFGNATKSIINKGLEYINENYLQALREGDYDPYKDAIQYSTIPIEKKGKQTGVYDYVESAAGAYGPAIKTTNLIIKTYSEEDKKEADAIQRQKDVKNIRIPLEVLGNAGFIPLYKDIRKEVMKEIYKGIEKGPSTKKPRVMSQEEYDRLTK